ncbi:MAG: peptidyl-prolyl cis-trans isomerase [Nitrospirota bacterium]
MAKAFSIWCGILLVLAVSSTLPSCAKSPAPQQTAEQVQQARRDEAKKIIVARVNSMTITMDSLVRMMNRLSVKNHGSQPADYMEEVKKTALDRLILQELAYQKARALGLNAEQKNIDDAIANFKANVGGEKEYADFLVKQGLTEADLRAQAERGLTLELIFAKEVNDKITVPQEDLKSEYEKEKGKYIMPEKMKVTDVVVFFKQDDDTARRKAAALLKKIRADKKKDPWSLVLDGTFIVRNLDVHKDKHREVYEAAKKLKPGKLSGVIKASDGLHIIKLLEYSPQRQLTFDEAKGSLEGKFRAPAQQKRLQEWGVELKKDAKIELLDAAPIEEKQKE